MKNSFFNITLIFSFLVFGCFSTNAQVRVKKNVKSNKVNIKAGIKNNRNTNKRNKKVVVKNNAYNINGVRVKTNRNRVVVNRPNRPKVVRTRPNYNRPGYYWAPGFWKWNSFFGIYSWHKARWIKVKPNHYWVPGFWEASPGGFYWIEGYWEVSY